MTYSLQETYEMNRRIRYLQLGIHSAIGSVRNIVVYADEKFWLDHTSEFIALRNDAENVLVTLLALERLIQANVRLYAQGDSEGLEGSPEA